MIQDASQFPTHWNNDWPTPEGGITKGQAAPLSLKAQIPYGIYNMGASGYDLPTGQFDQDGNEIKTQYILDRPGGRQFKNWSTDGDVDVNMTLIEDPNNIYTYPERHAHLSFHDGYYISPDTLHLYGGSSDLPATIDTGNVYPPEAYNRLIKVDNKTRVLLAKIHYRDWHTGIYNPVDGGDAIVTPLPQLGDRYAIILLLSNEDARAFCRDLQDENQAERTTLGSALQPIALIKQPIQSLNGAKLIDILE